MARDEPTRRSQPPTALASPTISLIGAVDQFMVEKLRDALAADSGEGDIAVEMTTHGGDAELGRRMALDVAKAVERRSGRVLFYGKTQVYSAGVTAMAGFPRENRFLSPDALLLIHCRQLTKTLQLDGPLRTNLPSVEALKREIESGLELERQGFEQLVQGSAVSADEVCERAMAGWYVKADEACRLGLVAGVV